MSVNNRREVILNMRLILCGLVALALLSIAGEANACNGKLRNGVKAVAKRVIHPFNGRLCR